MKEKKKVAYVSKRLVAQKSNSAFKTAASKAMKSNGYVVVAKDGWVVKEYADGTIERIQELDTADVNPELLLD